MIAYNSQFLDARYIREAAHKWARRNQITTQQAEKVDTHYPDKLYSPNIFVRIGLFIFTSILISCALGLVSLFVFQILEETQNEETVIGVVCLLYGGGVLVVLEQFIRSRHHYQSGIDDALLYSSLGLLISGIFLIFFPNFDENWLWYCLFTLPILVGAAIRYLDRLVAVMAYFCFIALVFFICLKFSYGKLLLPFVVMGVSAGGYFFFKSLKNRDDLRYWSGCLRVIEGLTLLTFYLSGNYFVVREGNAVLSESTYTSYETPETVALQKRIDDYYLENDRLSQENQAFDDQEMKKDTLYASNRNAQQTTNDHVLEQNYRLIGELTDQIYAIQQAERERLEAQGVPFRWLFLLFTFGLPLLYLYFALKNKDRLLLHGAMLTAGLAVGTYKFYYSLAPAEVSVTLAGFLLVALAYLLIRGLRKPWHGITSQEDDEPDSFINMQHIITNEIVATSGGAPATPEEGVEFGGGDFGGGGAGGKY